MDDAHSATAVFAAPDVLWETVAAPSADSAGTATASAADDATHVRLSVGSSRYLLRMGRAHAAALCALLSEVVPLLTRSLPAGTQLPPPALARIQPHLGQLIDLGVLLTPPPGVRVDSSGDRWLYSLLARTTDPAGAFHRVKAMPVDVIGPTVLAGRIAAALDAQGLTVRSTSADTAGASPDPVLTVAALPAGDAAALRDLNRRFCASRRAWVPVLFDQRRVRVGPWVTPAASACLGCLPDDELDRPSAPGVWATLRPGVGFWVAGLIAHQGLRALVPLGDSPPWGQSTTVDAVSGEQSVTLHWRDPYCPDCSDAAPMTDVWMPA